MKKEILKPFPSYLYANVQFHCVKSVQNTGKYGPEKTPYLDTFHTVFLSGAPSLPACVGSLQILHKIQ